MIAGGFSIGDTPRATYRALDAWLGSRESRKLMYETRVRRVVDAHPAMRAARTCGAGIAVRHYLTDILVFWPDGTLGVDASRLSSTTARRMQLLTRLWVGTGTAAARFVVTPTRGGRAYHVPTRFRVLSNGRPDPCTAAPAWRESSRFDRRTAVDVAMRLAREAVHVGIPAPALFESHACCRRPTCDHRRVLATWVHRNAPALSAIVLARGGTTTACSDAPESLAALLTTLER